MNRVTYSELLVAFSPEVASRIMTFYCLYLNLCVKPDLTIDLANYKMTFELVGLEHDPWFERLLEFSCAYVRILQNERRALSRNNCKENLDVYT